MKRKVQKGFTLVELIVVMILMGILMTAVVMILRPSQNTFRNITNKAYEEQAALQISKLLNGSLRYSTGVKVVCNNGDVPTESERGGHTKYIKLSNDYRDFNDTDKKAYYKGARGNFERGKIEGSTMTVLPSAVNKATFDDYDFQFSIPEFNSKDEQASLTIALKAMPMAVGEKAEQEVAEDIGKPNPAFLPQWDKYYTYSETFEFINIRNKDSINKKTTGVSVDPYNGGDPVAGLGGGTDFVDPRKSSGGKIIVDNTIWIFYTNPQEAEDIAPGAGSPTPTPGSSGGSSGGSEESGGTGGTGGSSAGSGESGTGSGGASGPMDTGTGEDKSNIKDDPDANPEQPTVTEPTTNENGGTSQNGENGSGDPAEDPNNDKPKKDTYGSVTFVLFGKGVGTNYTFTVSGSPEPDVYSSFSGNSVTPSKKETFKVMFNSDNQNLGTNFGYYVESEYMKDSPDKVFYYYNGTAYDSEAAAEAACNGGTTTPVIPTTGYGDVNMHFIASTDPAAASKRYYIYNPMNTEVTYGENKVIELKYSTEATLYNGISMQNNEHQGFYSLDKESRKGQPTLDVYFYDGKVFSSESEVNDYIASKTPAPGTGSNPGGGENPGGGTPSAVEPDPSCYKATTSFNVSGSNTKLYCRYYGYEIVIKDADTGKELLRDTHNQKTLDLSSYSGTTCNLVIELKYLYDQSEDRYLAFGSDDWGNNPVKKVLINGKNTSTYGTVEAL